MKQQAQIKTHIAFQDVSANHRQHATAHDDGFVLSQIHPKSFNFKVENQAVALIAWGLNDGDTVAVYRARVGSVGSVKWTSSDCGLPVSPDLSVNVAKMPYLRCGSPVVLTAENPTCIVDDVGVFFLAYSGSSQSVVEMLLDTVSRKCCCKD